MWLEEIGKLSPFFASQLLYWVLRYIPNTQPSLETLVVKCVPVLTLIAYILWHPKVKNVADAKVTSRILLGLIFSVVGDAFLVYGELFVFGMAAFGVAQMAFIGAFGWEPLKLNIGKCTMIIH